MPRQYDWDYYRQKYVTGGDNVTLEFLSELPNAPSLDRLKYYSSTEGWLDQRKAYQHQLNTKTLQAASTTEAEISARHMKLARALQNKALIALSAVDPATLRPGELLNFLKESVKIERDALGIENQHTLEIVARYKSVNLSDLTDDELEALHNKVRALDG